MWEMSTILWGLGIFAGLSFFALIWWAIWYVIVVWITFLPFLIAKNKTAMMLFLNIILAPTLIGWLILLIYAIVKKEDL